MFAPRPNSGSETSTPSNWNFTSPERPPRKWSPSLAATTPALVPTASRRLSTGRSFSFSAVMLCLVVEDLVSMRFSARTSISSICFTTLDSPSVKLRVVVAPASTRTLWVEASKPIAWTLIWTVPTGTPTITKLPLSSVMVPCLVPSTMTLAKAWASPLAVTLPEIFPVAPMWAAGGVAGAGAAAFCWADTGALRVRAARSASPLATRRVRSFHMRCNLTGSVDPVRRTGNGVDHAKALRECQRFSKPTRVLTDA